MTNKDLLEALSSPFPLSDVRQRRLSSKSNVVITYVSIDATIRRLNEVLGDKWSTRLVHVDVVPVTRKLDVAYLASIAIELSALDKVAVGVGADVDSDPDKAVKTALAEAIKKAGHQFGIALYLWDEKERQAVEEALGKQQTKVPRKVIRPKEEESFEF